ncbi:MAG: imidazolonepropionase [Planctomycetota bacterium]|nr:imidazolonepropionase [Planctomycetota bacterium]
MTLVIRNARVVTSAPGVQRGGAMARLVDLPGHDVVVRGGVIAAVRPTGTAAVGEDSASGAEVIEAAGRVLLAGLVDCHTHANWAGDRYDEWERTLRGERYEVILAAGGGIFSTVRAVREASVGTLRDLLGERLREMLALGSTTIEVKSGYGLTGAQELKMLRAAHEAAAGFPGTVVHTALLGHAIDPDRPGSVRETIEETLPAVHAEFPGVAIDAFVERGAWSVEDARRLFETARSLGHPVRLHADQFTSMGGVGLALGVGAVSIDHLEATTAEDLARLGASSVIGVGLPACAVHLRSAGGKAADLRGLIDAGGAAAVATNRNPGSAPCASLALAAGLGVRLCGLTPREAITACTVNAAAVLGLSDRGAISPGMRGDLVLLREGDPRSLTHSLGGAPVAMVVCAGRVVLRTGG